MKPSKQRKRDVLAREARTITVTCGGERHTIIVTPRGRYHFCDHTRAELRAELIAAALTGEEPCACAHTLRSLPHTLSPRRIDRAHRASQPGRPPLHPEERAVLGLNIVPWRPQKRGGSFRGLYSIVRPRPPDGRCFLSVYLPGQGEEPCYPLRSIMSARLRLKLWTGLVPLPDGREVFVLRLEAAPQPGKPGRAIALVPGRGGIPYPAAVKLVCVEGGLEARRIPGQAPPPRTTRESRAREADERVADLQRFLEERCSKLDLHGLEWLGPDAIAIGQSLSSRSRKRRLDWAHVVAQARRLDPGGYLTDYGGTVANAYRHVVYQDVGVAVRLPQGVVVFRGTADAHGGAGDVKILNHCGLHAFAGAVATRGDPRLAEVSAKWLVRYAAAVAARAGLEEEA